MKKLFKCETQNLADKKLITEVVHVDWLVERVAKSLNLQTVKAARQGAKNKDAPTPNG